MAQAAIKKHASQLATSSREVMTDRSADTAPAWVAISRSVALFWGLLSMINLIGELRSKSNIANIWWLDLRGIPAPYARGFLAVVAVLLISFALKSRLPGFIHKLAFVVVLFLITITGWDAYQFLQSLKAETAEAPLTVPFTAYVAISFLIIWLGLFARSDPLGHPGRTLLLSSITLMLCILGFPIAQIYAFGKQDQRQQSELVAVFSNHLPPGAMAESALHDRVNLAIQIYKAGTAQKIVFIGSHDPNAMADTNTMKQQATVAGVSIDDLLFINQDGDTSAATLALAELAAARQQKQLQVVSDFYQLLRIKLYCAQLGLHVRTVPTRRADKPAALLPILLNESAALWSYYLQPLAPRNP